MRKFFNTSELLYKEMQLKDKLGSMSDEEMINLLASDGMLVKRPLLIGENNVCVGFKESEWEKLSNEDKKHLNCFLDFLINNKH